MIDVWGQANGGRKDPLAEFWIDLPTAFMAVQFAPG
jgi:hypothetical protein